MSLLLSVDLLLHDRLAGEEICPYSCRVRLRLECCIPYTGSRFFLSAETACVSAVSLKAALDFVNTFNAFNQIVL